MTTRVNEPGFRFAFWIVEIDLVEYYNDMSFLEYYPLCRDKWMLLQKPHQTIKSAS